MRAVLNQDSKTQGSRLNKTQRQKEKPGSEGIQRGNPNLKTLAKCTESQKTARQAAVLSGNMEIKLVDSDTLIRTNFDKVTWAANQATALGSRNFQEAEGGGSGRNLMFYCDMREKPEPRPQERTSSNSKDSGRCELVVCGQCRYDGVEEGKEEVIKGRWGHLFKEGRHRSLGMGLFLFRSGWYAAGPSQRCRWSKTSRHCRRWADQAS
ncbi:hypothetical protein EYR41_003909 [Orbilia oligospora]|uniref:Uncharacterized protein n=1 Tax=Orbilia oligospora TaxID=2813651 RepID=A0A8H2HUS4_ORBOL|nr:hypothetical protein EYR41_003909 [Orbilia oligospora]